MSAGISNFLYKLDNSSHSGGFGSSLELGYSYNVKRKFAIVTGLSISMYNSNLSMDRCSGEYVGYDDAFEEFTFNYSLDGYSEKQSAVLFAIPVMARYSTRLGAETLRYYVAGGMKIGIPVSVSATMTSKTVTTSGFYNFEYGRYSDLPNHGFVTDLAGEKWDSKIRFNITPIIALETGLRFRIGDKKDLMTGIYLDYSLGDIRKSHDQHVLEYLSSNPSQFVHNSILSTQMLDKVNLFSAGLKIGLNF
jgi:hypothetical protein